MATVTVSALVTVLAAMLTLPSASGQCRDGFVVLSGVCLKVEIRKDLISWSQARSECQQLGGDLARLPSPALLEHLASWVKKNNLSPQTVWVGAEDTPSGWSWFGGPRISLNSNMWLPNEPLHTGGDGKVLVTNTGGRFYLTGVAPTSKAEGYVCQA